jgi:endonuclease YncB( thermonuclease family)
MRAEIKVATLLLFGVFWPITLFAQVELTGQITHVRDGDTIEVEDIAIRLNGLTCDERGTDLGDRATAYLRSHVLGKTATCSLNGERTYDRLVGRCATEELGDIGAHLILQTLCGRCERYDPGDEYAQAQRRTGPYAGAMPSYCKSN